MDAPASRPEIPPPASQKMKFTMPIAILCAGALIALSVLVVGMRPPERTADAPNAESVPAVSEDDYVYGSRSAGILMVEYSDLECPFCERIHASLKRIVDESEGEVAWVYRHLPLTSIHEEAFPAALAAECIGKGAGNDALWAFVDSAFKNQRSLGSAFYKTEAARAGISSAELAACLSSKELAEKVERQARDAVVAGAQGTPFVVILKGERSTAFNGALPYQEILRAIERVR